MPMEWIVEFLTKYWLTLVLGGIVAWLGKKLSHYKQLIDKEKEDQKKQELDEIVTNMKKYVDDKFEKTETSHEKLYKAVLDVQQKQFLHDCYEFLNLNREISLEEYKNLYTDYNIYTSLGGNGIGTMLFQKVEEKYNNQLFNTDMLEATIAKAQELGAVTAQQILDNTPPPPQRPTITMMPFPPNMIKKDEEPKG